MPVRLVRAKIEVVERLITDYELELVEPGCAPGASRWNALITFPNDISGVFPYLNARFSGIRYDHANKIIIWREDKQMYALRPREIRVALVHDLPEAEEIAREVMDRINNIWEERERITPSYIERQPPPVIEILKRLPQSNCRQCGYLTCMAFAADLSQGKASIDFCTPLCQPENSTKKEQIAGLFKDA